MAQAGTDGEKTAFDHRSGARSQPCDHPEAVIVTLASGPLIARAVNRGWRLGMLAGDAATLVKLLRVAMLVPIVLVMSVIFRRDQTAGERRKIPLPLFVIGFALLVVLGSAEWFPSGIKQPLLDLSRWCLVISISAIGMKTALKSLKDVGGQAIFLICAETVLLALTVLGVLSTSTLH